MAKEDCPRRSARLVYRKVSLNPMVSRWIFQLWAWLSSEGRSGYRPQAEGKPVDRWSMWTPRENHIAASSS
jgi:hypothetical protein